MIITRNLSNGIRVVMEEMPAAWSVSVGIWVKAGAVDETEKNRGISHFIEHMMFKGTKNRDARRIAADIDCLGAQMNAFTGKEATCYYIKSTTENYRKAADVLCDMLENSLFAKAELDREREVICEEIKMSRDDPDDSAHEGLLRLIYKDAPLGNSILGTRSSLMSITSRSMREHVMREYTRDSIVISAAGRFDPDELCEYFEGKLMSLGERKPPRKTVGFTYERGFTSGVRDIMQAHICMGTKALPMDDDRSYGLQILSNLFGGSMSSRLFQNIREQKGLAYSVFSTTGSFSDSGYFEIYAGVGKENVKKTVDAVKQEIDKLASESVTSEELDASREQMKASYVFSGENTSSRMIVNGKNYLLSGRTYQPEEVMAGYDAVTVEEIDKIKALICDTGEYSVSVISGWRTDLRRLME
ncbi:MAG: insulinase family protein [Eubacterium sp.]|nr:insulinase family protein [Eubacterium sp.]